MTENTMHEIQFAATGQQVTDALEEIGAIATYLRNLPDDATREDIESAGALLHTKTNSLLDGWNTTLEAHLNAASFAVAMHEHMQHTAHLYNDLVNALQSGDMQNPVIAALLQEIGPDLNDEYTNELIAEVQRTNEVEPMTAIALLGALRGDTPGTNYQNEVALIFMRLAAKFAGEKQTT